MQKSRKRKQQLRLKPDESETKPAKISIPTKHDPYPTHPRPTPEECLAVRDSLLACHGFPQEFAKYREQRRNLSSLVIDTDAQNCVKSETLDTGEESVLDGLIKTLLSQNTTEVNSQRAFANLKSAFSTWEDVSFFFCSMDNLVTFWCN